jgi:uncharacterized protein
VRKLIETIVKRLSERPDQAKVTETVEGRTLVYEISVPEGERGRLIGRDGRTVRAIRAFVGAAAAARGKRVMVRVRD